MSSNASSPIRFNLIFSLLLVVIAIVFAVYNDGTTEVNLFFFSTEGSTALVLILTFVFGVLVGLLSSLPGRIRARRKLKQLQKKQGRPKSPTSPSTRTGPSSASSKAEETRDSDPTA